ncbi:MAG TPA: glucoamylase family protein [Candidatus Acidoferrales bacterium]|nr:glucoamylase family protein [Candidatus Acidoferrales bacterium]
MGDARTALGKLSRRELLRLGVRTGALIPLATSGALPSAWAIGTQKAPPPTAPYNTPFYQVDEALLEEMENANFHYFWEQANPYTGIVRDRCNATTPDKSDLGSIAATGFGLTALCIGDERGYVPHAEARGRVLNTLRFLWKKLPNHRGFFFHWANINTGERLWDSEVSSVDTAILLCGVLTCREHFQHSEIGDLAYDIFDRVDWTWLSEDTRILPHGWTPESGFLQFRWDNYSEMMMMYLLGLGSSSHPLPPETWTAWKRVTFEYDGIRYIGSFAPLFVHQYSQAWFDFRGKRDQYTDYFQNSITATEVHRRFCMDLASQFPDYSDSLWGITASDSARGYVAWGGPPATGPIDGSVVPCAAAGSLPFLPQPAVRVLETVKNRYGQRAWTRYGFVDAFNPLTNWYDSDVVGIDTGISMVMAENARTGYVWNTFMKNPEAVRGMERAGFKAYKPSNSTGTD